MEDPYRTDVSIAVPRTNDQKNLDLVAGFHYVAGGLIALLSGLFAALQIGVGIALMKTSGGSASVGPPPPMGMVLITLGCLAVLLGGTTAALTAYAGRCIARRKHHLFCVIVAAFSSLWLPFGTLLGVFALVLLTKPHVRALFGEGFVAPRETTPVAPLEFAGWASSDAKRRYTRQAWWIGIPLIGLQLALPILLGVHVVWKSMRTGGAIAETASAAPFQNRIWFIESSGLLDDVRTKRLASVGVDDDAAPVAGPDIPDASRFLAGDPSGLWILGNETLARYEAGRVTRFPSARAPYWSTRPFDYGGPAILDWQNDEIVVKRLQGEEWLAVPGASWRVPVRLPRLPAGWAAVPDGSGFDIFVQFKNDLRWRHVGSEPSLGDPRDWDVVANPVSQWSATQIDGQPVLFLAKRDGLFDQHMQVLRYTNGVWTTVSSFPIPAAHSLAAAPLERGGVRLVLSAPPDIVVLDWDGNRVRATHSHRTTPLPGVDLTWSALVWFVGVIPSLVAAALLTRLMRRYRIDTLDGDGSEQMHFASVLQRGLAYGLDHSLGWVAGFVCAWHEHHAWPPSPARTLTALLAFWLATSLVTSYMEGRWGLTPGKWLLGIRVIGTDLAYCGFWRALLRNVLRFVDGIFSFAVGMFAVAFTRNWQRLGDLPARTLVVRAQSLSGLEIGPASHAPWS